MALTVPSATGIERSIPDSVLREIVDIEKRAAAAYLAVVVNYFGLISQVRPDRDIARYLERRIAGSLAVAGNGLATILTAFGLKPTWFKPVNDLESELNTEGGDERTADWVDAIQNR